MHITNKKELINILRNAIIKENDEYADLIAKNIKNNNLLEQEDESEEEPSGDESEEESGEESGEEPPEEDDLEDDSKNFAAEKALALGSYDADADEVTFDQVVAAVNILRAGKSLKNKNVKTELNDYYERLDENERSVLLLFLKELSKIMTGAIEGEDAQDPSDPKTYFDITKREKEEAADKKARDEDGDSEENDQEIDQQKQRPKSITTDAEDTTPPIRVNESQDLSKCKTFI